MLTGVRLDDADIIQHSNNDYTRTLVAPMDGMWENAVISLAAFWAIHDQDQYAGYFCLNAENVLLRFHLHEDYRQRAQEIFSWVISTYTIKHAIASTIEPFYFSLCLDAQKSISVHSYLFRDQKHIALSPHLEQSTLRKAEEKDWDDVLHFYQTHTEGPGDWIKRFLQKRFDREELIVLYEHQRLVATGECIPSRQQPFADLGMVVARSYRGKGLGSFMLTQLKKYCYEMGWTPICSCEARNYASKKAIEKAGFISEHRMMNIML